MRSIQPGRGFGALALLTAGAVLSGAVQPHPGIRWEPPNSQEGWAAVDRILGSKGRSQPGGVYKYGFPRRDLRVDVRGVTLKPALALGSWVAFQVAPPDTMAMGDLVLTEGEVTAVIPKLEEQGVEVTALHNHLLGESPRLMYLHVHARGSATRIAKGLRAALALTRTPLEPPAAAQQEPFPLDTSAIKAALRYGGAVNGGVYQVTVPRAEPIRADGVELQPAMGIATAINWQPTAPHQAAITGDFVLTANEINRVIQALRSGGIEVTAVHSHMLAEEPRLFFVHYWANADAVELARVLRAALDRMNVRQAGA